METRITTSKPNRNRSHCKSWFDILVENRNMRDELREFEHELRMVSEGLSNMFGLLDVRAPGNNADVNDILASLSVVISERLFNAEAGERELRQKMQKIIKAHPYLLFDL